MVGNDFDKQLGLRLAKLREEKGWSQEQLREKTGVERRETITQWENGTRKIKAEHILLLCEAFDFSADYLLGLSGDPHRTPSAVDELGLSVKAVDALKSVQDYALSPADLSGFGHLMHDALDFFLSSPRFDLFLAFFASSIKAAAETKAAYQQMLDRIKSDPSGQVSQYGRYDQFKAQTACENYPFARYSVIQEFSEMLDEFCGAKEIKELEKSLEEASAQRKEARNGEHSQD